MIEDPHNPYLGGQATAQVIGYELRGYAKNKCWMIFGILCNNIITAKYVQFGPTVIM